MALSVSSPMRGMIEEWEGKRLQAYPDPRTGGDPWTIGYGHTGPEVHPGLTITDAQADQFMTHDLANFAVSVSDLLDGAPTTQQQYDALCSFAYNVGSGTLKISQLLAFHKEGNYEAAAAEFIALRHPWFSSMPGLARRREGERAVYLNGAYQ